MTPDLIIRNAKTIDRTEPVDLVAANGRLTEIGPRLKTTADREIDAAGRLVCPPFVDCHLHLDAVLTVGKPRYNISGSHPEGIEVWGEYKKAFPEFEDLAGRVRRAVEWEVALGVGRIRTHVDVCDPKLTALNKLLEMRENLAELVDIQIVAFPQDGIIAHPGGRELMEEAVRLGVEAVGAIPHCEMTREDGIESIKFAFDLAEKHDRMIDMHCDETDDPQSRFLEVMAAETIKRGMQGRVTAGHATAMHSYNNAYAHKLEGLLRRAELNIVANPFDNSVLQARFDTYPKRRGLTRIKELLAAGVNVCLGHDSIVDPWYPLGKGDLLAAAQLAVHMSHMSGYDELGLLFKAITSNPARALGLGREYGLEVGKPADLVVLDCATVFDAVRLCPARLAVIRSGRVIARTEPEKAMIDYAAGAKAIDFSTGL